MKTCTFVATALVAATTATAFGAITNDNMVVVGTYETLTVNITADTTWDKPVFVAGTLRKIGAGTLTLRGEKIFGQGRIEVADGEMAITATGVGSDAVSEPAGILPVTHLRAVQHEPRHKRGFPTIRL